MKKILLVFLIIIINVVAIVLFVSTENGTLSEFDVESAEVVINNIFYNGEHRQEVKIDVQNDYTQKLLLLESNIKKSRKENGCSCVHWKIKFDYQLKNGEGVTNEYDKFQHFLLML